MTKSAVKAPAKRRTSRLRRRWILYTLVALAGPALVLSGVLGYYYVQFSRQIEARLHGERDRVLPRVFARPLELWRGEAIGQAPLVDR